MSRRSIDDEIEAIGNEFWVGLAYLAVFWLTAAYLRMLVLTAV